MSLQDMDVWDLKELINFITVSKPLKKELFAKFFPSIEDIEDYSLILPESFREFESRYEWIYIDMYMEENKAYAINTKAILSPPPFKPIRLKD